MKKLSAAMHLQAQKKDMNLTKSNLRQHGFAT